MAKVTKISELPIKEKGTEVTIDIIWKKLIKITIGNKMFTIYKPKSRYNDELKENSTYTLEKITKDNKELDYLMWKNVEIEVKKEVKRERTKLEKINDLNEACDELYDELLEKQQHSVVDNGSCIMNTIFGE